MSGAGPAALLRAGFRYESDLDGLSVRELANGIERILAWDCNSVSKQTPINRTHLLCATLETKLSTVEAAAVLAPSASSTASSTTETMGPTALAMLQVSIQCFECSSALWLTQ